MDDLRSCIVQTQWYIQLGVILPMLSGVNMAQQPAAQSFDMGSLQEFI